MTADLMQGLERVLIASAMLKVAPRYRLVLQAYDELVAVVPDAQAEEALEFMLATLREVPSWAPGLILDAEGKVSQNYDK